MSKFDLIRDCKHGRQKGKCDSCDLEQAADIIEQLQARVDELEDIVKAVAYIGVDFGYGNYELEQKYIYKARELLDPPKGE